MEHIQVHIYDYLFFIVLVIRLLLVHEKFLVDNPSLVSHDVFSLFTNVLVTENIELFHEAAYGHQTIPHSSMLPEDLRALVKMGTKEIPFVFENRQLY